MTETALVVGVALLALFVGVAVPVLWQVYQVLKRTRTILDQTGPRLVRILDQASEAAERLNNVGAVLEGKAHLIVRLLGTASNVVLGVQRSIRWVKSAGVGGILLPAIAAGARAVFRKRAARRAEAAGRPRRGRHILPFVPRVQ